MDLSLVRIVKGLLDHTLGARKFKLPEGAMLGVDLGFDPGSVDLFPFMYLAVPRENKTPLVWVRFLIQDHHVFG